MEYNNIRIRNPSLAVHTPHMIIIVNKIPPQSLLSLPPP